MIAESIWKRVPLAEFIETYADPVQKATIDCEACGECESRCPYGLPIREMMDESIALYGREKARYQAMGAR
jgi:predicted aldo/keto reductase-like oxidoreductase